MTFTRGCKDRKRLASERPHGLAVDGAGGVKLFCSTLEERVQQDVEKVKSSGMEMLSGTGARSEPPCK